MAAPTDCCALTSLCGLCKHRQVTGAGQNSSVGAGAACAAHDGIREHDGDRCSHRGGFARGQYVPAVARLQGLACGRGPWGTWHCPRNVWRA